MLKRKIELEKKLIFTKSNNKSQVFNYKKKGKMLQEHESFIFFEKRAYINEDFSEGTKELKKQQLFKQGKEIRKKEKITKTIHNQLISFETREETPAKFDPDNEKQEIS